MDNIITEVISYISYIKHLLNVPHLYAKLYTMDGSIKISNMTYMKNMYGHKRGTFIGLYKTHEVAFEYQGTILKPFEVDPRIPLFQAMIELSKIINQEIGATFIQGRTEPIEGTLFVGSSRSVCARPMDNFIEEAQEPRNIVDVHTHPQRCRNTYNINCKPSDADLNCYRDIIKLNKVAHLEAYVCTRIGFVRMNFNKSNYKRTIKRLRNRLTKNTAMIGEDIIYEYKYWTFST